MSGLKLNVPDEFRRGGRKEREEDSVRSGSSLIHLMCEKFGIADMGNVEMLDMGCGNKFVQAMLTDNLPIKRYVGIDIHPGLVEFLQKNVTDDRFTFHVSNTENDMYNPDGEPMSESTRLPLEEESFDVICMFSVFTHIAPHDYVEMLRLLRRYIKPDGRIFFSLFINEATEGGHGFVDKMSAGIAPSLSEDDLKVGLKGPADFLDWYPERPLWRAVYSREKAINLIADTGWEIESLNDPLVDIQHYMICKPI